MSLPYLCTGFESQGVLRLFLDCRQRVRGKPQTLLTLGRAQTSLALLSLTRNVKKQRKM